MTSIRLWVKSFGQLYENTIKKKNMFTDAGFDYIEMWESDWNNHMNSTVPIGGSLCSK